MILTTTGRRSLARQAASLVLFVTAILKLASLAAQRAFLRSPDPVLEIPIGVVLTLAALTELAIALVLFLRKCSNRTAGIILLWFTACSAVYRIVHSFTSSEPCPCLGYLPRLLYWGTQATNVLTVGLLAFLGVVGMWLVLNARRDLPYRHFGSDSAPVAG